MQCFILQSAFCLLLLGAGCASSGGSSSGERTIRFTPPPVQYETFEPVFPTP